MRKGICPQITQMDADTEKKNSERFICVNPVICGQCRIRQWRKRDCAVKRMSACAKQESDYANDLGKIKCSACPREDLHRVPARAGTVSLSAAARVSCAADGAAA
jgi:hypothetical protein